jgi:hypothetical protein
MYTCSTPLARALCVCDTMLHWYCTLLGRHILTCLCRHLIGWRSPCASGHVMLLIPKPNLLNQCNMSTVATLQLHSCNMHATNSSKDACDVSYDACVTQPASRAPRPLAAIAPVPSITSTAIVFQVSSKVFQCGAMARSCVC